MKLYTAVISVFISLFYVSKSEDAISGGTYQKNKYTNKKSIKTINNKGPKMCVKECLQINGCSGVNFDRANLRCELLSDEDTTTEPMYKEGSMYTDIHHWKMPENPCWPTNPCSRRQKCVPTNQNGGYTCIGKQFLAKECSGLPLTTSGIKTIYPNGTKQSAVAVYCYVDSLGHIWTVIQRRLDGSVDFNRPWEDYKKGFGNVNGEYWLGNDKIHELTRSSSHALMILMTDFSGVTKFAEYSTFHVANEEASYRISVGNFNGNAGDSFTTIHNHQRFSTFDRDNDIYEVGSCAAGYQSGWWFGSCYRTNLNGLYSNDPSSGQIHWNTWHGLSMKTTMMMVRGY